MGYHNNNYRIELREKNLSFLDNESKNKLLELLDIPNNASDYVITVRQVEYWNDDEDK